jgi:hypothetical protein
MELRVVGDLLTATVDGKKIAEARDSTLTAGRPAFSGHDLVLESFEYANLDPGGSAPASPIATTTKPGDMRTFTGHRYQFHAGPFIKDEARDLASSLGGHLVTITSAAEQAWIEATFAELIGGPKKTGLCLTGGAQGCEKWSNGEPWGYTNWKTDISKAKSDFLVLSQDGGKCPWQPTFWTQPTSAIVEWNDDKSVPALASAKPGDVLTFGGHRYQLVMEKLSWEAAKAKAEAMGGHLATITSPEENDWMLKNITVPGEVLLGGSQAVKNGPWKWVTGEAFDLKLWGRSGPDGSGDKVAYDAASKHWDDVPTTHPVIVGFLVEWDSDAPAKPASPDGWQDALALVDLSRDDPKGDWQRDGHSLKPPAGEISMCAIPIVPAPSYDLRVRVRREGDAAGIWVAFTKQEHAGCFVIDCNPAKPNGPRHAGLEMLKGKHVWDTEQVVERPEWLKKGLNEIIMQVRDEGLVAFLDGKEIYRWKGNWADLSLPPGWWEKGKAPAFSLRNWRGKMTFEDISWRPVVEEKGGALASALPATPAAAPAPAPTMPAAAPAPAPAAPVAPADPRLAQLAAGFKARHEADALQPFNTALAALNTSYVANGVSRARTAAKAKGSLAEVTALDAEKTAIEQGRGVPAEDDSDTVESLKTLRVTYRTAHAKFAAERDAKAAPLYDLYLKALDAYIAELTQADKIDAARKVQVFRDDIALQKPAAGAAAPPATPTAPASSAAAKPTTRAPKMNEHEVAEWAIAAGGSVEVLFGTPPVRRSIAIATELPRGRFVIFEMRVNCAKVLGNDLSPLASAQDVGRLHLDNSPPDKTFLDLTPLRQMTALRDVRCSDQDAAAVDVIASLSELTTLYVGKMPEGSLEKIAKLKQLSSFGSPSITGPGIAALKSCKKLHDIRSEGTASDEDVRALAAALPDLDYLVVSGPALTNACIPSVLSLKSLNSLTLDSDELDDSVIEPLGKLPNLSVLKLHSSKVVGSNLDVLKKFSSLRELYLDGCSITDDALDVLVQLKGLTKLQLRDTKVTDAGIAKFKAARPDCEVTK